MTVHYCPSCQTPMQGASDCPACGISASPKQATIPPPPPPLQGGASLPRIVTAAARPKSQAEVELVYLIDRTGSSEQFKTGIPKTAQIITDQVAVKARQVYCTLWSCGDEEFGEEPILHTNRGTPEQLACDIKTIHYGGGADADETHLASIEHVLDHTPWPADLRRCRSALIAMLTADTKPAASGHSAAEVGEECRRRGVGLYLICEPFTTLEQLVTAAGGLLFEISNSPDPKQLQQISSQVAASIVATLSSAVTLPMAQRPRTRTTFNQGEPT